MMRLVLVAPRSSVALTMCLPPDVVYGSSGEGIPKSEAELRPMKCALPAVSMQTT